MPELPEVETVRRSLARRLASRTFVDVAPHFPGVLEVRTPDRTASFPAPFLRADRTGKILHLLFEDEKHLFAHFRMTGGFYFRKESDPLRDHTHVEFLLDNGERLAFRDPRRFGGLWWYEKVEVASRYPLAALGPDALEISLEAFAALLRCRNRMIKPLLLDQALLAGLGNIYVDESLFRARIHPKKTSGRIAKKKVSELWRGMREILAEAIEQGGSSIRDYEDSEGQRGGFQTRHLVYNRKEEPCVRCGNPIRRIVVAQRGTWICSRCQR